MATNVASDAQRLQVTANAAYNSGDLFIQGALFGICQAGAASGGALAIVTRCEAEIPKSTAMQIANPGVVLYWDAASGRATTTVGSNVRIGVATRSALTAATTIRALVHCG